MQGGYQQQPQQQQMQQQMQQQQQMPPQQQQQQQMPPQQDPYGYNDQQGQPDDRKRARGEQRPMNNDVGDASPVLHMRNVTPHVSQHSLQNLALSFGRVKNIVMLRQKNQALLEMESEQCAQQMVDFFKDNGYAEVDGRRVYIRFSQHDELSNSSKTSKTLLVSMFNTRYDLSSACTITPMIVYQIFGNYGAVEKIVVLPKNASSAQNHNRVQALVQFDAKESAESVKTALQGQPVTLGDTVTFTLDIQYSKIDEITASNPHNSLVVPKQDMAMFGQSAPQMGGGGMNAQMQQMMMMQLQQQQQPPNPYGAPNYQQYGGGGRGGWGGQ